MTIIKSPTRFIGIRVTDEAIIAELADGRTVSVPLASSWRLSDATPEQRANWRIIGSGNGIHWPAVDEDISVRGMLDGVPAHFRSHPEQRLFIYQEAGDALTPLLRLCPQP